MPFSPSYFSFLSVDILPDRVTSAVMPGYAGAARPRPGLAKSFIYEPYLPVREIAPFRPLSSQPVPCSVRLSAAMRSKLAPHAPPATILSFAHLLQLLIVFKAVLGSAFQVIEQDSTWRHSSLMRYSKQSGFTGGDSKVICSCQVGANSGIIS